MRIRPVFGLRRSLGNDASHQTLKRKKMPKIPYSLLAGERVTVEQAITLRDDARESSRPDPDFRCPECDGGVRPHRAGHREPDRYPAHFEHLERDRNCDLSHVPRS
jgi:hypothetical protein